MNGGNIDSLDDLTVLYWQNREALGAEEQRLFQGILLELQKGEDCDRGRLETLLNALAERCNLI